MRALDKHVPTPARVRWAEADVDEAHELLESGDTLAALSKMADALAADPTNDDARFDYVRLLIATGGAEGPTPAAGTSQAHSQPPAL